MLHFATLAATDAAGVLGQVLFTTGTADFVDGHGLNLGRPYSTTNPSGLAIDKSVSPNRIYVVDPNNNRVLGWNDVAAFTTHAPADLVFGQASPYTGECNNGNPLSPTAATLCGPRDVAVDGAGNVYIADTNNNRVLEYDTPFTKGTAASRVFGQGGSFTSAEKNLGGISANSMFIPDGVAVDASGALYVAEQLNSRVLIFKTPLTSTTADLVLGQGEFHRGACNRVARPPPPTLCKPQGLALDASSNLYVADVVNNRVLEYNAPIIRGKRPRWSSAKAAVSPPRAAMSAGSARSLLCAPRQVALDAAGNLYIADTSNHRVLEYNARFQAIPFPIESSARWANSTATSSIRPAPILWICPPASRSTERTTSSWLIPVTTASWSICRTLPR